MYYLIKNHYSEVYTIAEIKVVGKSIEMVGLAAKLQEGWKLAVNTHHRNYKVELEDQLKHSYEVVIPLNKEELPFTVALLGLVTRVKEGDEHAEVIKAAQVKAGLRARGKV